MKKTIKFLNGLINVSPVLGVISIVLLIPLEIGFKFSVEKGLVIFSLGMLFFILSIFPKLKYKNEMNRALIFIFISFFVILPLIVFNVIQEKPYLFFKIIMLIVISFLLSRILINRILKRISEEKWESERGVRSKAMNLLFNLSFTRSGKIPKEHFKGERLGALNLLSYLGYIRVLEIGDSYLICLDNRDKEKISQKINFEKFKFNYTYKDCDDYSEKLFK